MVGRGAATLVLLLGLVVGVILGVLAPNNFGIARNDKPDHGLRGIATSINSDVRDAASAGEVSAFHAHVMRGSQVLECGKQLSTYRLLLRYGLLQL